MDYSRTEANPPHPFKKVMKVAHEVIENYYEPTQPNPGYNEADAVRSVRLKSKRCHNKLIGFL
jgi:ribosomal protein S17E